MRYARLCLSMRRIVLLAEKNVSQPALSGMRAILSTDGSGCGLPVIMSNRPISRYSCVLTPGRLHHLHDNDGISFRQDPPGRAAARRSARRRGCGLAAVVDDRDRNFDRALVGRGFADPGTRRLAARN